MRPNQSEMPIPNRIPFWQTIFRLRAIRRAQAICPTPPLARAAVPGVFCFAHITKSVFPVCLSGLKPSGMPGSVSQKPERTLRYQRASNHPATKDNVKKTIPMNHPFSSLRFLLPLVLATATLHADPEWTKEITSSKPGSHPAIESCKLEFSLSWKGIVQAGYLDIEIAPKEISKPGYLVIKSTGYSQGFAKKLFPYSHSYWSEIVPGTLESRYFQSTETDSKEKIVTTNQYSATKVDIEEITTRTSTSKKTTLTETFGQPDVRDLFSAILFVRSQKLDVGDRHTMLILPFKSPYLLKVSVDAKEKHEGKDAIRLSFALQKINMRTQERVAYKKLKKPVTLWLSDDADRIPLELRASVYIGDVRAVLAKHTKTP
jgi:hypothetical protein